MTNTVTIHQPASSINGGLVNLTQNLHWSPALNQPMSGYNYIRYNGYKRAT